MAQASGKIFRRAALSDGNSYGFHLMQRSGRISTVYTGAENLPKEGWIYHVPESSGKV